MSEEENQKELNKQVFQSAANQQQLPRTRQQAGYDVPVESVTLPSAGRVYPLGHPLCNEKEVEIRCMSAREEDILTSRPLIKSGLVITKLIESCLLNKTIDVESLLPGDRNALMIAIRATGYGTKYSASVTCPECSKNSDYDFMLDKLKIKPLGAEPTSPNTNLFQFTLPFSKRLIHFKFLTAGDEREMSKELEKVKKITKTQVENTVTTRLRYSIVSVDGDSNPETVNKAAQFMIAGDSRALRSYMGKIEPDVEMKHEFICPACAEVSEVEIPLGVSFFWPDT